MKKTYALCALLAFLLNGPVSAHSEMQAAQDTALPAHMSDAALASYISGRLNPLLKDTGHDVSQDCDAADCSVVVQ